MKTPNIVLALALLLQVYGCRGTPPSDATAPETSPTPITIPTPYPSSSFSLKCTNCSVKEQTSINHAYEIIQVVNKSKCFRDFMVARKLTGTLGLTNQQVVDKIVNWVNPKDPIPLVFYRPTLFQSKRVIGYTYPNSPEIYLNRSYRSSYTWTDYSEASNIDHEVSHKVGFDHLSASDAFSVPYSVNRALEFCTQGDKLPAE